MPLNIQQIKTVRVCRGLSVTAAARAAGFKRSSQWHDIESGRQSNLSIDTLERVARSIGVTAAELLR